MTEAAKVTGAGNASGLASELDAVREAAEVALETRAADGDVSEAQQRLTTAAKAALDAGHALSQLAEAEAAGQAAARDRLRKDVLRRVERSARRLRDVTAEHETLIAQADALGLGAREIAERASIAHGTVAAIVRRHAQRTNGGRMVATEAGEDTATTSLSSRQARDGSEVDANGATPVAEKPAGT